MNGSASAAEKEPWSTRTYSGTSSRRGPGTVCSLDAVRAGTADEAEAAVRANWLNSATRLLAALDRWGARGGWILPPASE